MPSWFSIHLQMCQVSPQGSSRDLSWLGPNSVGARLAGRAAGRVGLREEFDISAMFPCDGRGHFPHQRAQWRALDWLLREGEPEPSYSVPAPFRKVPEMPGEGPELPRMQPQRFLIQGIKGPLGVLRDRKFSLNDW
jgi:hypothetical protein